MKKFGLKLSQIYDKYVDSKKNLLNNTSVLEYMYNRPLVKIMTKKDLLDYQQKLKDLEIQIVRLELKQPAELGCIFMEFQAILNQHDLIHMRYVEQYVKKFKRQMDASLRFDLLPILYEMSDSEKKINKILSRMVDKMPNHFVFTYKWKFNTDSEEKTSLSERDQVQYRLNYQYDFFGMTFNKNQLMMFVIVYDEEEHFNQKSPFFLQTHQRDITTQYLLSQSNIHLLRLHSGLKIEKEIYSFIKKIRNGTKWIIQNKIKPIPSLFQSSDTDYDLESFCQDYEYNRKIYLQTTKRKKYSYDSDDDEFFQDLITERSYSTEPADEASTISDDFFKEIIKEKEYYHPDHPVDPRIEEIMVQLVGK